MQRSQLLITVLLTMLCFSIFAEKLSMKEVCKLTKCSSDKKIVVRVSKEKYFEGVWPQRPYYFNNVGSIVMGEELSFEAIADDKGKITLRHTPNRTKTSINIKLTQPGTNKEDVMSVVSIQNGSQYNFVYQGGIYHTESGKFRTTSVCAILANKGSFESWPYAISLFSFSNLKSVTQEKALAHGCK